MATGLGLTNLAPSRTIDGGSVFRANQAKAVYEAAGVAENEIERGPLVQPRLFRLDEAVWLKALKLDDYAARKPRRHSALQGVLFPYLDAL